MPNPHVPDEVQMRIAELEARITRLEQTQEADPDATSLAPATSPASTSSPASASSPRSSPSLANSATPAHSNTADHHTPPDPSADDDPYWVLTGLQERHPDADVILYAGTMSAGDGVYRWQYGLPTESVLEGDFADAAPVLTALAHPVRLALVQAVLTGTHTTADLAALPGIGTSGQVYHHLNLLASGGWLRSPRRGRWEVPGERTIPLLALVMAAST